MGSELSNSGRPVVVIACKVFQELLKQYLPAEFRDSLILKEYALHQVPKNLRQSVQESIDSIEEPSLIILGYGLCGNGLARVTGCSGSWRAKRRKILKK